MPETEPTQVKVTKPVTDAHRLRSQQVRTAVNQTLYEATQLKALTFRAAMEMKEEFETEEESDKSRARAQAITGLVKSWSETVNVIRIERGKPLPGSLRPESKPKKQKQASWAMVELVPKPKQLPPVATPLQGTDPDPESP